MIGGTSGITSRGLELGDNHALPAEPCERNRLLEMQREVRIRCRALQFLEARDQLAGGYLSVVDPIEQFADLSHHRKLPLPNQPGRRDTHGSRRSGTTGGGGGSAGVLETRSSASRRSRLITSAARLAIA